MLTQDAVALVAEVLQADLSGASEVVEGGDALSLRIVSSPLDAKPVEPAVCELPLGADESMAGYALATAVPVVSDDLTGEKRFSDRVLRNLGVRRR